MKKSGGSILSEWGHHNIHYHGDANAFFGCWSPPTSRANFCEEDYVVTRYVAEFINSITNVSYVYLALRWMYHADGHVHRSLTPNRWDFMSASLLILGVGSFLFHASLRQSLEFVDELSMMLLSWSMLQSVFTIRQTPRKALLISSSLALGFAVFSVFYVYSGKIIYQVIAFITSLLFIVFRTRYLVYSSQPRLSEARRTQLSKEMLQAVGISLFGYLLWNIDLQYCKQLRTLKHQLGLPLSWALELHGWWHVLTALGADKFMRAARVLRQDLSRHDLDAVRKKLS